MKNENPVIIPEKPANIDSAQLHLEQAQHRLERTENRRAYFRSRKDRERNHRLILRGVAIEHFFPETVELTEREFFELVEEWASFPPVSASLRQAMQRHNDQAAPLKEAV